jgi:hypothetical protein
MGEGRHFIVSTSRFPVVHVKENQRPSWYGYGYTDWKPLASPEELGIATAFADFWRQMEAWEESGLSARVDTLTQVKPETRQEEDKPEVLALN